jgi:Holliday junction resolvase
MEINSRDKGARGEREWAKVCTRNGFDAKRGRQYCGGPDSPDVICPDLCDFHFEVKRVERLNLYDALGQARRDAGDKVPVVAHRKNHSEWLVTMPAEDWFNLVREAMR